MSLARAKSSAPGMVVTVASMAPLLLVVTFAFLAVAVDLSTAGTIPLPLAGRAIQNHHPSTLFRRLPQRVVRIPGAPRKATNKAAIVAAGGNNVVGAQRQAQKVQTKAKPSDPCAREPGSKLVLADGTQKKGGSCVTTPQGTTAQVEVTMEFILPVAGARFFVGDNIPVAGKLQGLQAGSFDDPKKAYYEKANVVNRTGAAIGHPHYVAQRIDGNGIIPPTPIVVDGKGFQAADQPASGDGGEIVVVTIKGGLPEAGEYRVCSMCGGTGHQPCIAMQSQVQPTDSCVRITAVDKGNGGKKQQQRRKASQSKNQTQRKKTRNKV